MVTESQEQAAVISWWAVFCKTKGLDERLLFAIPNAQKFMSKARNMFAAYAVAKKEGLRIGVADLMLAVPKHLFHGLFIEMKVFDGKVSAEQLSMADLFRRQGYNVVIAYGADEAMQAVKGYLQ